MDSSKKNAIDQTNPEEAEEEYIYSSEGSRVDFEWVYADLESIEESVKRGMDETSDGNSHRLFDIAASIAHDLRHTLPGMEQEIKQLIREGRKSLREREATIKRLREDIEDVHVDIERSDRARKRNLYRESVLSLDAPKKQIK